MIPDSQALDAAAIAAAGRIHELNLHTSLGAFMDLLDKTHAATLADLAKSSPDKVQFKQGALAQLVALQQALNSPGSTSPKAC